MDNRIALRLMMQLWFLLISFFHVNIPLRFLTVSSYSHRCLSHSQSGIKFRTQSTVITSSYESWCHLLVLQVMKVNLSVSKNMNVFHPFLNVTVNWTALMAAMKQTVANVSTFFRYDGREEGGREGGIIGMGWDLCLPVAVHVYSILLGRV